MNNQDIEKQLIGLAYSMALEPQRWHVMTGLMDKWMLGLVDESADANIPALPTDTPIIDHFMDAMNLMDRQGRKYNHGTSAARLIDSELEPAALVTEKGIVSHCNGAAESKLGFRTGSLLPKQAFEYNEFDIALKALRKLTRLDMDSFVKAFNVNTEDGETIILGLSITRSLEGEHIGRLTTISQSWHPNTAQQFQASLNLTPTELAITKTIVSGQTLTELAKQRGQCETNSKPYWQN